jgi:hypothetical protein
MGFIALHVPRDIRSQPRRGGHTTADTPTFGRYAEIPVEKMTADQQAGYRLLVDGPRGRLPGPYRVWVHNPALVHAVEALGHDGVTDLIVLMGYYTCVSLTMNFYSVPVSGGGTPRH